MTLLTRTWHHWQQQRPAVQTAYLALAVVAAQAGLYLHLIWLSNGSMDRLSLNSMAIGTVAYLVWQRRAELVLKSTPLAQGLGFLLLAWATSKGILMLHYDGFMRLLPSLSAVGLTLVATGFQGLRRYRWELLVLFTFTLLLDNSILTQETLGRMDLTESTATGASTLLWYLGFDVSHQGTRVVLPTGAVDVGQGCSPETTIILYLKLSLLLFLIFPTTPFQKGATLVGAFGVGFLINLVRVVIMALLVAANQMAAFDFWHEGTGAQAFSLINSLVFFWLFEWIRTLGRPAADPRVPPEVE